MTTNTINEFPDGVRFIANPDLVLREEEDNTALLFDPETGAVRVLNATAVAIWNLLDGSRDLTALLASLHDEFDEMDAEADAQVKKLLDELLSSGAIGVVEKERA